jgi:sugar-phosphatase
LLSGNKINYFNKKLILSLQTGQNHNMLDTVIFDMDGLLIDSEPLWGEALDEVFSGMDIHLATEQLALTTGLRTNEVVDYWYHRLHWKEKSPDQVTREIVDTVTVKILEKGSPMDGLAYILDFFTARDFKIGLASSSPMALIMSVLDHLDIRPYFQAVYSAEYEDYGKPHPAVYLACARELGSKAMDCVVFEDSVTGLIAAKAARMKAVAVPEAHRRSDPRYVLADMQLASLREFSDKSLEALAR